LFCEDVGKVNDEDKEERAMRDNDCLLGTFFFAFEIRFLGFCSLLGVAEEKAYRRLMSFDGRKREEERER